MKYSDLQSAGIVDQITALQTQAASAGALQTQLTQAQTDLAAANESLAQATATVNSNASDDADTIAQLKTLLNPQPAS